MTKLFGQRVLFCIFDCFFNKEASLVVPELLFFPPTKGMAKYFRLNNLTDFKVIHLIFRNLYTNTAKFEHTVPLKLLQWFHQTIFSRTCFQRRT